MPAEAAIEQLFDNYSDKENFADCVLQIAGRYGWDKRYDKAFEYYRYLDENYAGSVAGESAALESGRLKVNMYLDLLDEPNSVIAIDEFIERCSGNAQFGASLMEITRRLAWEKRYDSALKYFDYMAANLEDEGLAADAALEGDRLRVIRIEDTQDEPNTLEAIDDFIVKHAGHPRVGEVVLEFAQYYDWKNNFEPNDFTDILFNRVVEEFSGTPSAAQAQIGFDIIRLRENLEANDVDIPRIVDEFIDNYIEVPGLFEKLSEIVERYYSTRDLIMKDTTYKNSVRRKVVEIGERIAERAPENFNKAELCYLMGDSYRYLEEYYKAISSYQAVVENYPGHRLAGYAQYRVGDCYERMYIFRKIEREEGIILMKDAYQKVIDNFPDCPMIRAARSELKMIETSNLLQGGE